MEKGTEQETPQTFEALLEALARNRPEVLLVYDNDRYHQRGELPPLTAASLLAWKRQAETPRHRVGAAIGVVHVHAVVPRTGASWMFTTFVHEHG